MRFSRYQVRNLPRIREVHVPTRFLILIPAHNEEDGLPETLQSLSTIQYPKDLVHIVVIADRCADDTAKVARAGGAQCLERSEGPWWKGCGHVLGDAGASQ
jgi:1,2-diacylglycerol 3-beta-glucosyltransferase